jgi:hypothetical protein
MSIKNLKYIFFYNNKIIKYDDKVKINSFYDIKKSYDYFNKISIRGINWFIRDNNITDDFIVDFIVYYENTHFFMIATRKKLPDGNFLFLLEPLMFNIENNKFSYNNVIITNTCRCNNFEIKDYITEIKIVNDNINEFDETQMNFLDNLPYSVEKIYLFYDIKKPVANLPHFIKKIYVYDTCNTDLIKVPFDCELIKI